jgi:hypothetical protein
VDVGRSDHGVFPLWSGAIGDALAQPSLPLLEEPSLAFTAFPPLASWGLPQENNVHSKPSGAWKNVDLLSPAFLQDPGGFSSLLWDADPSRSQITLV